MSEDKHPGPEPQPGVEEQLSKIATELERITVQLGKLLAHSERRDDVSDNRPPRIW